MPKVLRGGKWGSISRGSSTEIGTRGSNVQTRPLNPNLTTSCEDVGSILSLIKEKNKFAIASYDFTSNEIYISRAELDEDFSLITSLTGQVNARAVVLPSSYATNELLLQAIQGNSPNPPGNKCNDTDATPSEKKQRIERQPSGHEEDSGFNDTYVSFIPNAEFGARKAAELCSLIQIKCMPEGLSPVERLDFLYHITNGEDIVVRAIGGLLSFMIRNGVFGAVTTDSNLVQINKISYRNFFDVMRITAETLHVIRVFSNETHPVGHGSLKGKEGVSLFGLLKAHIKTVGARELLQTWLRYPSTSIEIIKERRFLVYLLRKNSNSALKMGICNGLRGVKNIPAILQRLRRHALGVSDWKALFSSLKAFIILMDTLKMAVAQDPEFGNSHIISQIGKVNEVELREAANCIDTTTDFEESAIVGRMVVAQGYSQQIDDLKRSYGALDDFLTEVGAQECRKLQNLEESLSIACVYLRYRPQVGFLVVLTDEDCNRIGMDRLENIGLSFIFRSPEQEYHFKNDRCRNLDEEIGDIHGAILDLESETFRILKRKMLSHLTTIFSLFNLLRELDCIQALAAAAAEYSWVRPIIAQEESKIDIVGGRHPLLELLVPSYVPNATTISSGSVMILTGPNYSGKSTYLAQVALIIVLAQIGSYVPAKEATLTVVPEINGCMSGTDSISSAQSSFFMDSSDISRVLRQRTNSPKSLNLVDEFGKGTLECDGMALYSSFVLSMLSAPIDNAPFTICATHFVDVLSDSILPHSNPRLHLFSMEVMPEQRVSGTMDVPGQSDDVNLTAGGGTTNVRDANMSIAQSLHPTVRTYRLLAGTICEESRALQCARECNIPKFVLQRTAHIRACIRGAGAVEMALSTFRNMTPTLQAYRKSAQEFLEMDLSNVSAYRRS